LYYIYSSKKKVACNDVNVEGQSLNTSGVCHLLTSFFRLYMRQEQLCGGL